MGGFHKSQWLCQVVVSVMKATFPWHSDPASSCCLSKYRPACKSVLGLTLFVSFGGFFLFRWGFLFVCFVGVLLLF